MLRICYGLVSDTANTSIASRQQVVVMAFGKRHDTTDTTDFCPRQLVTDLLRGNCCNGFRPLLPLLLMLLVAIVTSGRHGSAGGLLLLCEFDKIPSGCDTRRPHNYCATATNTTVTVTTVRGEEQHRIRGQHMNCC